MAVLSQLAVAGNNTTCSIVNNLLIPHKQLGFLNRIDPAPRLLSVSPTLRHRLRPPKDLPTPSFTASVSSLIPRSMSAATTIVTLGSKTFVLDREKAEQAFAAKSVING